jgi:hypothetical protein
MLYKYFQKVGPPEFEKTEEGFVGIKFFTSSANTCKYLWYGILYVTCDAIKTYEGIKIEDIYLDYNSIEPDLKQFRHGVFHVKNYFWTKDLFKVFNNPEFEEKVLATHELVGKWLIEQYEEIEIKKHSIYFKRDGCPYLQGYDSKRVRFFKIVSENEKIEMERPTYEEIQSKYTRITETEAIELIRKSDADE